MQRTAAAPPRRLGFVYIPHGVIMNQWTPATTGAGFEFTPILKPLEPYRERSGRGEQPDRADAGQQPRVLGVGAGSPAWRPSAPTDRTSATACRSTR